MSSRYFNKLLWLDLEYTGLDLERAVILEVGLSVTDDKLNEITSFEAVINQSEAVIKAMKKERLAPAGPDKPELKDLDTVYDMHEKSGLLDRIRQSEVSEAEAEAKIIELISKTFKDELIIMAGNSIFFDRTLIRLRWPKLDKLLYYRMVDVSSFKLLLTNKNLPPYEKKSSHRALSDARESAQELKYYLDSLGFKL